MDDERLMNMAERESFIATYDAHSDALFRFAFFAVHDRELAKDLVADTFTKVWEYIAKGNSADNIRALCYCTLRNLVIDHFRKRKSFSLDALTEAGFDPAGDDGRRDVERAEDDRVLKKAIAELPAVFREVVVLRHVEGYTPKEIAEALGITQSLVSVRLFRGIALLKQRIRL